MPILTPLPGQPSPPLVAVMADGTPFDLLSLRPRTVLVEFHRGTW